MPIGNNHIGYSMHKVSDDLGSKVVEFGYSKRNKEFVVRFINGKAFIYKNVSEAVARKAFTSISIGQWIDNNLKGYYAPTSLGRLKGYYLIKDINLMDNLCASCKCGCPAECDSVKLFGNGQGNDNICYCDTWVAKDEA